MAQVTINIGTDELTFEASESDFNSYINEQTQTNKVAPAFNFLSRTVIKEDKEKFKKLLVCDGTPKGTLVMQIAGVLAEDSGAGIEISVKK